VSPAPRTTLLVVEDDAELRALYRTALALAGYTVIAVDDGISALRWIEADRPDGIVLDLMLPRLGGRDVQAEIAAHAETRDIPIVVVTGTAEEELSGDGVRCVLRKPVEPEVLVRAAKRCFPMPTGFSTFG
jgi:CheY-like chemotaxis protein